MARDQYGNQISYSNPIYVTCPNLDYHNPEQSVINIPTYGTASVAQFAFAYSLIAQFGVYIQQGRGQFVTMTGYHQRVPCTP